VRSKRSELEGAVHVGARLGADRLALLLELGLDQARDEDLRLAVDGQRLDSRSGEALRASLRASGVISGTSPPSGSSVDSESALRAAFSAIAGGIPFLISSAVFSASSSSPPSDSSSASPSVLHGLLSSSSGRDSLRR
jgi:hypothetical protein